MRIMRRQKRMRHAKQSNRRRTGSNKTRHKMRLEKKLKTRRRKTKPSNEKPVLLTMQRMIGQRKQPTEFQREVKLRPARRISRR